MDNIIFWSGFCFGVAIITAVYACSFLISQIVRDICKEKLKSKITCEDCSTYDEGFGCVRMTECPKRR